MAKFKFGTGTFDKRSKIVMQVDVVVFAKTRKEAETRARNFIGKTDDLYLKEIEETPNDSKP